MDDIFIPGGMTRFTYDEFHPDPIYDNTRTALEDCIKMYFREAIFQLDADVEKRKFTH
jgi:hypothetical protein